MVWLRDLALFGFLCASCVPAAAGLDTRARDGSYLLPRAVEHRSGSIEPGKRAHLRERSQKCAHPVDNERAVAYYEGWAGQRACNPYYPRDIDAMHWTHINFAFAVLDTSGKIVPSSKGDVPLYNQTVALKNDNKDLQVWIAVGGQGMGAKQFSEMASSDWSRREFINSAKQFMGEYGFDGIDIDWEYPTVADKENLVNLVKEMRQEFGNTTGISMTIPSRSSYLDGFDLLALQSEVDMLNFMSYDLHGPWDRPLLAEPGTNLTEIDNALQQLEKKGVSMNKLNLGLAYYGYSYILENTSCKEPGCPATGAATTTGPCGETTGALDIGEIQQLVTNNSISPTLNKDAAVMYFTWDENHWVSYDNSDTLQMKTKFARDNCLGGSFVWAVDMENPKRELNPKINGSGPSQLFSQGLLVGSLLCICFVFSVL